MMVAIARHLTHVRASRAYYDKNLEDRVNKQLQAVADSGTRSIISSSICRLYF
jgi:hypothetical protein